MQVVEDDQHRAVRGQVGEERRRVGAQPVPALLRGADVRVVGAPGQRRDTAAEARQQFRQVGVLHGEGFADARRASGHEVVERGGHRAVRLVARALLAGRPQHDRALRGGGPGRLGDQPGLADAGLATDQGESPDRARGVGGEQPQRADPPEQRGRRRRFQGGRQGGGKPLEDAVLRCGDRLLEECAGRDVGVDAQFGAQRGAAGVVLADGLAAPPEVEVEPDEPAVQPFVQGVGGQGRRQRLDPAGRLPAVAEEVGQRGREPAQQLLLVPAGRGRPGGVAVFGQQRPVERGQRGGQGRRGGRPGEGRVGRSPDLVQVDPGPFRDQLDHAVLDDEVGGGGAGRQARFEGTAGGVQGDAQADLGGLPAGARPQQALHPIAVQ